ncbi:MAG: histidine phosphotransferase family protein [Pseudomonadota bacterium]
MPVSLTQDQIDFAAQVCSRLCHDLISPVGAIANGLEILADETDRDMQQQVIELLTQSVQVTSAKLRFFRLAFGAPGGMEGAVDAREVCSAAKDYIEAGKAALQWDLTDAQLPKPHVKSLLVSAMLCADSLVRGGTISVSAAADGGFNIVGQGTKVVLDPEIANLMAGSITDAHQTSRYAPYILLLGLAQTGGLTPYLQVDEASVSVRLAS